jgi:MoCo/4Fe-4S cofactor protein with predicted Tat translocation signal
MLKEINREKKSVVYGIEDKKDTTVKRYILSTPETRAICNDPLVMGYEYTEKLEKACSTFLRLTNGLHKIKLHENRSVVFNILRGGLNFGLRGALAQAFEWNNHSSSFVTAQRARITESPELWHITEDEYQKITFPERAQIILGDVVATGTSLKHGLDIMIKEAVKQGTELSSILFFTIGGQMSEQRLIEADKACRKHFPNYEGTHVCYIEGRFFVPTTETNVAIKITGTDLMRCNSLMAPEFIESNFESPSYPLERCTIYDAGSRAFQIEEYRDDVIEYWKGVLELAKTMTFEELLSERFPEIDAEKFGSVSLEQVAKQQLEKLSV